MSDTMSARQGNAGASRRTVKIVLWSVSVLLMLLTIWQNWGMIDTKILFFTVTMPRIAYAGILLLAGFFLGLAASPVFRRNRNN